MELPESAQLERPQKKRKVGRWSDGKGLSISSDPEDILDGAGSIRSASTKPGGTTTTPNVRRKRVELARKGTSRIVFCGVSSIPDDVKLPSHIVTILKQFSAAANMDCVPDIFKEKCKTEYANEEFPDYTYRKFDLAQSLTERLIRSAVAFHSEAAVIFENCENESSWYDIVSLILGFEAEPVNTGEFIRARSGNERFLVANT